MFKIGDAVWIKSRELRGTVSYYEPGYIEIELDNGSTVDFESTKDLEQFTNQVASPKKREPSWAELFQSQLDD